MPSELPGPPIDPLAQPTPEEDLAVDMGWWSFWTPVTLRAPEGPWQAERPGRMLAPPPEGLRRLTANEPFPDPGVGARGRLWFNARLPQWVVPNYWARPFDQRGELCVTWYERWYTVLEYTVPQNFVLRLEGLAFEAPCLADGEIIEVAVWRSGALVTRFEEFVANSAAANPAERMAFSGHVRPVPVPAVFDSNNTLRVDMRARGPYPFAKTENDQLCCTLGAYASGWLGDTMRSTLGGLRASDAPVGVPPTAIPGGSEGLQRLTEWLREVGGPDMTPEQFQAVLRQAAAPPTEDNRLTWAALFAAFSALL